MRLHVAVPSVEAGHRSSAISPSSRQNWQGNIAGPKAASASLHPHPQAGHGPAGFVHTSVHGDVPHGRMAFRQYTCVWSASMVHDADSQPDQRPPDTLRVARSRAAHRWRGRERRLSKVGCAWPPACNVSRGSFYWHFKDIDQIIAAATFASSGKSARPIRSFAIASIHGHRAVLRNSRASDEAGFQRGSQP